MIGMIPNTGFAMGRKRSIEVVDDDWEEQAKKRPANAATFVQLGQPLQEMQGVGGATVSEMA